MATVDARSESRSPTEQTHAAAKEYIERPAHDTFAALRGAVEHELQSKSLSHITSTVLTPVGVAIEEAAEAFGFTVGAMIDFDDMDRINIEWEREEADRRAVPEEVATLFVHANSNAGDRELVFAPMEGDRREAVIYVDRSVPTASEEGDQC
jgi:hypothetical protein